jgi:hypothetical protein
MNADFYVLPIDGFLPGRIIASCRTATEVGRWLERNGFTVTSTTERQRHAYAVTADGVRVFRNGRFCWVAAPIEAAFDLQ